MVAGRERLNECFILFKFTIFGTETALQDKVSSNIIKSFFTKRCIGHAGWKWRKQKKRPPKGNILRHLHTDLNMWTVFLTCTLQPEAEGAQWPSRFAPSNLKIKVKPSNFIFCCKCQKLFHCFPLAKLVLKPLLRFHLDIDL